MFFVIIKPAQEKQDVAGDSALKAAPGHIRSPNTRQGLF